MHAKFGAAWVFCTLLAYSGLVAPQERDYPKHAIRLIVPFAPGGTTDILGRNLAEAMGKRLRQPVVVENRSGAGGALGIQAVASAVPDGYTLGISTFSTHIVAPACNVNVRYDPNSDFTPIGLVADTPVVLVGRSDLTTDFKSFRDLVAGRGDYTYGTPGKCSFGHLMLERVNQTLVARLTHVPYRGSAPAAADLAAGHLDFMTDTLAVLAPLLASGRVKPLAVAWPKRLDGLAETPTFAELGFPELNMTLWYGLVGPSGLPRTVTRALASALSEVLSDPEFRARLENSGMFPVQPTSSEYFKRSIQHRYAQERTFMKSRRMSAD